MPDPDINRHAAGSSPLLLKLVWQFLHYRVEDGGTFHTPKRGIARSSSLSPLLAAFHLYEVDAHFAHQPHLYYARYMDDFFIVAKTRWQLRKAVRTLIAILPLMVLPNIRIKPLLVPPTKGLIGWDTG
ncbi:reverse transcriptase domain-containing protein [Budvicia aquatica]|uniref:Retron-type reverse transcriptase n=1 Tax=Budvicia aquatica TaxID=82979 RepID=A0A484ZFC1_9GAMM|nr:reverse transcriptase domain-containing protein [Budvicia aquatica]VFS47170.1 Retron-type reverse transcriptase [Budvicia aquatica]